MRVAVVGASGNVGTALLRRLKREPSIELIGIARRTPDASREPYADVDWHRIDIGSRAASTQLHRAFLGCDAVIDLAWQIQPNHREQALFRTNVAGTSQVLAEAKRAGVTQIAYASSVGAYSAAPKDQVTNEDWPTGGLHTSHYSSQKALVERRLGHFETDNPDIAVSRLRPGLIFQSGQAAEAGRYFLGPLIPLVLTRIRPPLLPLPRQIVFQAVHADDVAEAFWRVLERKARGAFNIATDPVLDPAAVARVLGARGTVGFPLQLLRSAVWLSWMLRVQRTDPGWLDMAVQVPIMSTERARDVLGWQPAKSSVETLRDVVEGMRSGAGVEGSPPLRL